MAVEETSERAAHVRPLKPIRSRRQWLCLKQGEVIRALEHAGFYRARSQGEHIIYAHYRSGGCVAVPHHKGDVRKGALRSILRRFKEITGEDLDI